MIRTPPREGSRPIETALNERAATPVDSTKKPTPSLSEEMFEAGPSAGKFPALLRDLSFASTKEEAHDHLDRILTHLNSDSPIANRDLDQLKKVVTDAKHDLSTGIVDSLRNFLSTTHAAQSDSFSAKTDAILELIGSKKALNDTPAPLMKEDEIINMKKENKELAGEKTELADRLDFSTNSLSKLAVAGSESGKTIEMLTGKHQTLEKENTELKQQLELLQNKPLEPKAVGINDNNQAMAKDLSTSEGRLKRVQVNLDDAKKTNTGLRAENASVGAENTDLTERLAAAKATNAKQVVTLQAKTGELDTLKADHKELSEDHARLTNENGDLKRNVEKLTAAVEAQATEHAGALENMQAETMKNLMDGLLQKLTPELYAQVMKALSPPTN